MDALPSADNNSVFRFTVIADAYSARMFYSFPNDGGREVISYRTVDLTNDVGGRLPESYGVLAQKKIGIVGCGSLGSKKHGSRQSPRASR
jgi:sulfur-carrier protein adenylyltransferase/sulfurtransferase